MDLDARHGAGGRGVVGTGEEKGRRKKVELLQEAIHGLLEEKRQNQQHQLGEQVGSMSPLDQEDDLILSSLLSKLDAMEKDIDLDLAEPNGIHPSSAFRNGESSKEVGLDDMTKELIKIRRQNMITHILLGAVIVMTAVWQFNEVSFLLAVQKKLANPFKYLGDIVKASLKRKDKPTIEASPLPPVGIPDITRHDLPMLAIGNDES